MELECFKYKEKMSPEKAVCRHPGDYCKYRTSCIIFYLEREREKPFRRGQDKADDRPDVRGNPEENR
ncbi:MAG TPA: RNA polymerase II-associated protein [Desulfobacteraceae bacterium]|mgnify:CR=1 FL=1|nr:RNA polymerase II-associated protein [Desulfobacteraceae bacterium]